MRHLFYFFEQYVSYLVLIILLLVTSFSLGGCATKSPLVKTWFAEYDKDGKNIKLRSVFGNTKYENFATIDDGEEKQLLNGHYKVKDKTITITITHEFDEKTKELKKLKTAKIFSESYVIVDDHLIIGKNEK